jgi:hypothetical protein
MSILKSGNDCCHSVQYLSSSHLLSKNVEIRRYKTIILPVVWYGCETWSDIEDHRLRVFGNRVLRRILRPKRDEMTGGWRNLHNEALHYLYLLPSIIRMIKEDEMGRVCSTNGERRGMHIVYRWKRHKRGDH